jgi:hypothetical protein
VVRQLRYRRGYDSAGRSVSAALALVQDQIKMCFCIPPRSCSPEFGGHEFKIETIGFRYPNLFYLPSDPNGCSESSVARFELAQPISRQALHNFFSGFPPKPTALSDEAFALFLNHLGRFWMRQDIDKVVCEQIDIYRDLVLEELPKARERL